jgi:cellulose biosynthesis protein BcsE
MNQFLDIDGFPENCQYIHEGAVYTFILNHADLINVLLSSIAAKSLVYLSYQSYELNHQSFVLSNCAALEVSFYHFQHHNNKTYNYNVDDLCIELSHLKIQNAVICLDFTDILFLLNSTDLASNNLKKLQQWAEKSANTIFLLFNTNNKLAAQQFLHEQRHHVAGQVILRGYKNEQTWSIKYWFGLNKVITDQQFKLEVNNNRWSVIDDTSSSSQKIVNFSDNTLINQPLMVFGDEFFNTESISSFPKSWQLNLSKKQLIDKTENNPTSTVIINYDLSKNFEDFARFIFTLRQQCELYLKIIIIEKDIILRATEQKLLKKLGANLIVSSTIPVHTLINIVEALHTSLFPTKLPSRFEDIFNLYQLSHAKGYLPANNFIKHALQQVTTAQSYDIDIYLIKFECAAGLEPIDTVKFANFKRNGDFFTLTDSSVYLFLFGCSEAFLSETLTSIFGVNPSTIFKNEVIFNTSESIQIALDNLAVLTKSTVMKDYSYLLIKNDNIRASTEDPPHEAPIKKTKTIKPASPIKLTFKNITL